MSKLGKTILLIVAFVAIVFVDTIIKEANGIGIPALLKYLILFGIIGAIAKVRKGDKEDEE